MKHITLLGLLIPSIGYANTFVLPIRFQCQGKWIEETGIAICNENTALPKVKIKIPPSKGQIWAYDCEQELIRDDFNTVIYKTGWWLWRRTIVRPSQTPEITLPFNLDRELCPITIGLGAYDAGVQTALVMYLNSSRHSDFLEYSCAKEPYRPTVNGVGSCHGIDGTTFKMRVTSPEQGILDVFGPGCVAAQKHDVSKGTEVSFQMVKGACAFETQLTTLKGTLRSRFLTHAKDIGKRGISNPVISNDGDKRRVFKPIGASVYELNAYYQGKTVWQSGSRDAEDFWVGNDDVGGFKEGLLLCATAYSQELNSVSGACYDSKTNREVPYTFN